MNQASSSSLASALLSKDRNKTFAELYEEIHDVMDLRVKISNSLMVIALREAETPSKNLTIYLGDALSLCKSAINALKYMEQSIKEYNMMSKLFKDIFESERTGECTGIDKTTYSMKFHQAWKLFKRIDEKKSTNESQLKQAKDFLLCLDKDVEQTYIKEEALYFGYLRSTAPSK